MPEALSTNLSGKIAVVSGATGGVGYATCQRLARQGATVVGLVRKNLDDAKVKFAQLPNPELEHLVILADVTNTTQIKFAVDTITTQFGRCDILVNAAGSTQLISHHELTQLTDDIFHSIIDSNLFSVFATIREFYQLLISSQSGLIINISSLVASRSGGSNLAYASAKAGVESLTRNLARVMAPTVRVIGIAPSYMETGFVPTAGPEKAKYEAERTPLGRNVTPDDIAAVIESCATNMTFITGQCIMVDGGRSL
jgi:3-oxoacyl-[acyl-carrier protein] reductase